MLRGKAMVKVEGATQALRRAVNAVLEITPGVSTTISVPGPFGALILKAAAYQTDSRDRERHLYDAVALLACIKDPYAERESFAGSDRSRLRILDRTLVAEHGAWLRLPRDMRTQAQAARRARSAGTIPDPSVVRVEVGLLLTFEHGVATDSAPSAAQVIVNGDELEGGATVGAGQ